MKILFMGTPSFAAESLAAVYESGEEITGVITAPDKPKGRGMALMPSEVKKYAEEKKLALYQPVTLKDEEILGMLNELKPELIIVAAYGKILPEYVLDFPKYGCINVHASILPKYRGAAPIQRAIIDGETETGVSIMRMDKGLDTGDVLLVKKVTIHENDNFESVHDKLAKAGREGLSEAISLIKENKAIYTKQAGEACYAEKIKKEDCFIDFSDSAINIRNKIRGLSPYPLAFTKLPDGKMIKIISADISDKTFAGECGEIISLDGAIHVKCRNGAIAINMLIPEGKGKMKAVDFINGRNIKINDILG